MPIPDIIRIAKLEGLEDPHVRQALRWTEAAHVVRFRPLRSPDLILLEESTVGMDIESRCALWDQVRPLAERLTGKGVVFKFRMGSEGEGPTWNAHHPRVFAEDVRRR